MDRSEALDVPNIGMHCYAGKEQLTPYFVCDFSFIYTVPTVVKWTYSKIIRGGIKKLSKMFAYFLRSVCADFYVMTYCTYCTVYFYRLHQSFSVTVKMFCDWVQSTVVLLFMPTILMLYH